MFLRLLGSLILMFLLAGCAVAQSEAPQPSPELKKLDYFTGTWKVDAQMKAGPFGPGGPVSSTDRYAWQQGNFFLIGHSDFKSPMATGVELSILGYDPAKKVFLYSSYNSSGERESGVGTVEGNIWTWHSSEQSPMHWRYVETVISATSYRIKFDISQDGSNWATVMEGTASKQ